MHFLNTLRVFASEVVLLSDIGFQIIEMNPAILVSFEKLEIPFTDRPSGDSALIAVVGIVPKQRLTIQLFAL